MTTLYASMIYAQQVYYLVKWEGYGESENTWEAADSLAGSGDEIVNKMIAEFEARDRGRSSGGKRSMPFCKDAQLDALKRHCFGFPHYGAPTISSFELTCDPALGVRRISLQ